MTASRRRAYVVAGGIALTTGVALLGVPAVAGTDQVPPVDGVTLTPFVVRDAAGQVTSRGATATLPGHVPLTPLPATTSQVRIATAHRGATVRVRHLEIGEPANAATASR